MPNPVQLCPTTSSWIAPRLAKNIHGECTFYGRWLGGWLNRQVGSRKELMPNPVQLCPTTSTWTGLGRYQIGSTSMYVQCTSSVDSVFRAYEPIRSVSQKIQNKTRDSSFRAIFYFTDFTLNFILFIMSSCQSACQPFSLFPYLSVAMLRLILILDG